MCKGEHSSSKRVLLAERFFCFLKFGALTSIKKKTKGGYARSTGGPNSRNEER